MSARPDRLIYMANQIGAFFGPQNDGQAPAKIAEHLTAFWHRSMLEEIIAWVNSGGDGLTADAQQAVLGIAALRNRDREAVVAVSDQHPPRGPGDDAG